jgi:hypothetical protein
MQREHDYERLAEREQAEPVDVAAEDAKRDNALRAEIGTVFRAYGNRRPQLLPAMETQSPCRSTQVFGTAVTVAAAVQAVNIVSSH